MKSFDNHPTVSADEYLPLRKELLAMEKEYSRKGSDLAAKRQSLPWVKVESEYFFESEQGRVSLADLFCDKSQLLIYHAMYEEGWEEGCPGCSLLSDHFDAVTPHLNGHDVAFVVISRAPLSSFRAFKKRMGWKFPWLSSQGSEFNFDFQASYRREDLDSGPVFHNYTVQKLKGEEQPGLSAFVKDSSGTIYHTYSTYERGLDDLVGTYQFLDLAPYGRNEQSPMDWLNFHDRYHSENTSESPIIEPDQIIDSGPILFAGLAKRYDGVTRFEIPTLWQDLDSYWGKIKSATDGVGYGVCGDFASDGTFQYIAAMSVDSLEGVPPEFTVCRYPAQKYAVFDHHGHVSEISNTIMKANDWYEKSGYPRAATPGVFERYGPSFDPATCMDDLQVWIPIGEDANSG